MLNNILVPLDGSALAEAALPYATTIAGRSGASLALTRAARSTALLADMTTDQYQAVEEAEQYLGGVAQDLVSRGFRVTSDVPFGGSAVDWIAEEAQVRQADLIIMATHARVGPDRWLHGSVAEAVVHRSTVPIMLVRANDADLLAKRFEADSHPVLVVPLDSSSSGEPALSFASELARALDGQVVRYGGAAAEVAAAAQDSAAAAVVMPAHERDGLLGALIGNPAADVVHHYSGPVVLVHRAPADQGA